jgi:predicted nucleic acid-binding protein
MPAVSNTSPISNLAWIGRLDLLPSQFGEVWIPRGVEAELRNVPEPGAIKTIEEAKRSGWLRPRQASSAALISLLSVELHPGEAEAIALALETKPDRLLIDETDGRNMARQLGIPLTGVLGVLLRAKKTGQIKAVKPEIDALRNRARFFVGASLEAAILREANER